MIANKTYKFGKYTFKSYFRATGQGWEVGMMSGTKYYFVGNFIHEKEAKKWWSAFNKHIATFAKQYEFYAEAPRDFYGEFMATSLYKEYYHFLAHLFTGYNSFYAKGYEKYNAKYEKYAKVYAA